MQTCEICPHSVPQASSLWTPSAWFSRDVLKKKWLEAGCQLGIALCPPSSGARERGEHSSLLVPVRMVLDCEQSCVPGTLDGVLTYASLLCSC